MCKLLQLIEWIEQRFVVLEFEQLGVVQFFLVFERLVKRFIQCSFEFRSVVVTAILIAAVIKRGGTEQQCR